MEIRPSWSGHSYFLNNIVANESEHTYKISIGETVDGKGLLYSILWVCLSTWSTIAMMGSCILQYLPVNCNRGKCHQCICCTLASQSREKAAHPMSHVVRLTMKTAGRQKKINRPTVISAISPLYLWEWHINLKGAFHSEMRLTIAADAKKKCWWSPFNPFLSLLQRWMEISQHNPHDCGSTKTY